MPQNKRESLIYSVMMCCVMVFGMSVYNAALHTGGTAAEIIRAAWLSFPLTFCVAIICDWFLVGKLAKGFAFKYLLKPESSQLQKVLTISCCMVIPMVIIMSMYGSATACAATGDWSLLVSGWLRNIPRNFIVALPLQLVLAGPLIRKIFRRAFPVGKVL